MGTGMMKWDPFLGGSNDSSKAMFFFSYFPLVFMVVSTFFLDFYIFSAAMLGEMIPS